MATFVVLTAGLAGFHAKTSQLLPGVKKLWEGLLDLNTSVFAIRAYRKGQHEDNLCDSGNDKRTDSDPGDDD